MPVLNPLFALIWRYLGRHTSPLIVILSPTRERKLRIPCFLLCISCKQVSGVRLENVNLAFNVSRTAFLPSSLSANFASFDNVGKSLFSIGCKQIILCPTSRQTLTTNPRAKAALLLCSGISSRKIFSF